MNNESETWQKEKEKLILQRDRNRAQFSSALQWLELFEDGTNLIPYFKDHNCRRIAIYGAAEIARLLLKEIENDSITKVSYFLDKSAENQREKWGIPVYLPEEFVSLPDVDMVVVTAIYYFDEIYDNLLKIRQDIPVVSLNTILDVRRNEVWYEKR